MFLDWEWWQLCLVALLVFLALIFTNYIIKKINEARIEERFARLAQGQVTNQGTQYEGHGLNSFTIKMNVPIEDNKPPMTIPRTEISLTSNKDECNYQDYRTQKEASIPKSGNTGGLKEVREKKFTTLPCTVRILLEKSTDITTDTAIDEKDNNRNTSKNILANIVFPISEILQNSEVTTSTEGITHVFKEKITENVLSLTNDVGVKICLSNSREFQLLDMPDGKIYQKNIDNSSLQSNEVVTNVIEAIPNEFSEISQKPEEPVFEIESEREKIKHTIIEKASNEYSKQEPETSQKINKSLLLSIEALPQERNVTTKKSEFLKTDMSQAVVAKLSRQTGITSLKDVMEKNFTTLPCTERLLLEKPTDITTDTAMDEKDNNIRNTSKHILADIVFPMSEIIQNSDVTTLTEGITHVFKEKITENVLSLTNDVGVKICQSNSRNFQMLDMPDDKIYQKIIDNSSLQSNVEATNIIEAIINEFSEISQKTEEPVFEIESEKEKIKHTIIEKASTEYSNQEPKTSPKNIKSPQLSREALPLKSEISQAVVAKLSQQTGITSLTNSSSSVKTTNTTESTQQTDLKKDDNYPTTTIGLVMLDVSQKVGNSLFHNTNHFINENKHKVTNVTIANSNVKETENYVPLKSNNLDTKNSDTKNVTLAKDIIGKITSSDTDPQTSKLKKKARIKLPPPSGYSSKAKYTRNLKNFWEIFLNYRRS